MQGIPNLRRLHWIHGGGFSWTGRLVFTQILTPNQFTGMVEKLVLQDSPLSELEDLFNNQSYSDYYVVFLRLVLPLIWMTLPPLDSPYLATCSVTNPFTPTSSRMIRLSAGSVKRYDFVLSIVFFFTYPLITPSLHPHRLRPVVYPLTLLPILQHLGFA